MKLVNLGCGGCRPPYLEVPKAMQIGMDSPWINIDELYHALPDPEQPERINLAKEHNYINADLRNGIPLEDNSVDGILASHFFEHLDLQEAIPMMKECKRVLRDGGILRISVPCPKKFYTLSTSNSPDWGESFRGEKGQTFMNWALFFAGHKQLLTIESLFCLFWDAGFSSYKEVNIFQTEMPGLADLDNRPNFSVFAEARK